MTIFSVWAPEASERVDLVLPTEGGRLELVPDGRRPGWWAADVPEAGPGTDYLFSIDGGPGFPDPRSEYQPEGVHGPSRVVDHSAFEWTDHLWRGAAPLSGALVYEAHVGTFTPEGTFEAAIERLAHLVELGVTHLELLPVVEFPGERGWGYDGVDLFAPHHAYGGPDGLKRLASVIMSRDRAPCRERPRRPPACPHTTATLRLPGPLSRSCSPASSSEGSASSCPAG